LRGFPGRSFNKKDGSKARKNIRIISCMSDLEPATVKEQKKKRNRTVSKVKGCKKKK
jgi:hypothetical protein